MALPLYSNVKEPSAISFAIPSYTGGTSELAEIFGYVDGSITFRNFVSGVTEKPFISGAAKGAEAQRGSDLAKMMKLLGGRRVILVRAKFAASDST